MQTFSQLPEIIILYGPPLAGKGTQAAFLEKLLPDYIHLDFGTAFREFVANHKNNTNSELQQRAVRMETAMAAGSPIETDDLRFVVENTIVESVKSGKKLLIEGPGRKIEEARWLSAFFRELNINIAIFHLHIDLDVTIARSKLRWYAPNNTYPYIGFDAAKAVCTPGDEPYQRVEDKDPAINTKRYNEIYDDVYALIIQTYQLNGGAHVYTLDASDTIENVSTAITTYLSQFYGFNPLVK